MTSTRLSSSASVLSPSDLVHDLLEVGDVVFRADELAEILDVVEDAVGEDLVRLLLVEIAEVGTAMPAASNSAISPPVDVPGEQIGTVEPTLEARFGTTDAGARSRG